MSTTSAQSSPTSYPFPLRGFTLVELLVVIGIIAVLISILLPVLGRVRAQSNDVVCQSNIRQIAAATINYAVDNRDRFPYGRYSGGSNPVYGALGQGLFRVGYNISLPGNPTLKEDTWGYPAAMFRLGYLKNAATNNSVWMCPAALETLREYGNSYRWGNSKSSPGTSRNIARDGTSKDRARYGRTDPYVYDNLELAPANIGDPSDSSSVLPKPSGAVLQYYPHYTKSKLVMGFDDAGNQYSAWRDPGRGVPVLYTFFTDGHVGRMAARSTTNGGTGYGNTFGGFAPAIE